MRRRQPYSTLMPVTCPLIVTVCIIHVGVTGSKPSVGIEAVPCVYSPVATSATSTSTRTIAMKRKSFERYQSYKASRWIVTALCRGLLSIEC